jgi:hypothetical protein
MKNSRSMKILAIALLCAVIVSIFGLSIRGLPGNPAAETLNSESWKLNGPLELSPERGRFALIYSLIEDHSLQFSLSVAHLAIPDLAVNRDGKYVSLFAPGSSFISMPGYLIGRFFGAGQIGAFATIAIFALLNFLLIYFIAIRLGAQNWAAFLGALTFSFATPAFAYGVNLYQHHISAFLLLLSLYLLLRYENYWSLALIWFACAASFVIDNPNIFLMLPVGLFALWKTKTLLSREMQRNNFNWSLLKTAITFLAVVPPLLFFLWYNTAAYGNPMQLPGTLPSVREIGQDGKPVTDISDQLTAPITDVQNTSNNSNNEKTAIGFFKTRNLYNGFYEHFISPDRGIIYFTPIILLGIIGLILLYRRNSRTVSLMVAILGVDILLYSMWGDPYGGWAFGSRYLIPSYALMSIGVALALSSKYRRWLIATAFFLLFVYSAWVNTLGALTSSANPPQVEVLSIEQQTGHEQKYTFMRNWEFLNGKYDSVGSKAAAYQIFAKNYMSATEYFSLVYGLVLCLGLVGIWQLFVDTRTPDKSSIKKQDE